MTRMGRIEESALSVCGGELKINLREGTIQVVEAEGRGQKKMVMCEQDKIKMRS